MHASSLALSGNSFSALVDYIPLAATVVTCFLSVILARATLRYAEATDKSLALAREEFEREWSPELHIKLERTAADEARIVVTNLAKISVLLQLMQVRKISHAVPFERSLLNDPLVGGMTWTQDIGKPLLACTGAEFTGLIAASVTFYSSGRMFRTDWFRFHVQVSDGRILRVNPTNVPARRVRVLENRRGPERRREHAQDVTADAAAARQPVTT
jgi:membrane protein YdbS with pleckstrin-like domain